MTQLDWGSLLGEMIIRRDRLTQLNPELWQPSIPGAPATGADLRGAETRLGRPLDAQHRDLLLEGDGWQDGFGWGDLLRADEIGAGEAWARAREFLGNLYATPSDDRPPRGGLCPVLVGDEDVVLRFFADDGIRVHIDGQTVVDGWDVYDTPNWSCCSG